jgi:large subunit ribosomal protein L28
VQRWVQRWESKGMRSRPDRGPPGRQHGVDDSQKSPQSETTVQEFKRGAPPQRRAEAIMARQCEVCGKKVQMGNRVETRGKAKYLGGVGTKITGITRRKFVPNLQRVHVTTPEGENKSMRVCVQCIRSGAVRKTVRTKPFDVSGVK